MLYCGLVEVCMLKFSRKMCSLKSGIVDMDHAGLRKRRQHFVRALGRVVGARLQRGRPERGVEAREAVPGLVD